MFEFFNDVMWFFTTGIGEWIAATVYYVFEFVTYIVLLVKVTALSLAWGVANQMLIDLNVASYLAAAWSGLDSETLGYMSALKIPQAINIIVNAAATRFILNAVGF